MGRSTIDYQCRYLHVLYLLRTYFEITEWPIVYDVECHRQLPDAAKKKGCGNDGDNVDNDNHCGIDNRSKE